MLARNSDWADLSDITEHFAVLDLTIDDSFIHARAVGAPLHTYVFEDEKRFPETPRIIWGGSFVIILVVKF